MCTNNFEKKTLLQPSSYRPFLPIMDCYPFHQQHCFTLQATKGPKW